MYSLNKPVAQLRTKMRQEFERHRYVSQIGVVDMLLFQSHAEFQVRGTFTSTWYLGCITGRTLPLAVLLKETKP
jgi:hypothetical protein